MPDWLNVTLVILFTILMLAADAAAVVWLARRLFHRPRTEYLVADELGTSADAARIAMVLDIADLVLAEQSALFWEDRDEQLNNVLLEIRKVLAPSTAAVS